jgi:hypothetical protein
MVATVGVSLLMDDVEQRGGNCDGSKVFEFEFSLERERLTWQGGDRAHGVSFSRSVCLG